MVGVAKRHPLGTVRKRCTMLLNGEIGAEAAMVNWRDRIVSDPEILLGKPTVKGTRISVELILGWLAEGWTFEQLLDAYPHITRDDILAALAFAAEMMRDEQYVAVHKAA
jgi:uncharacterized protein (DUF433 family)